MTAGEQRADSLWREEGEAFMSWLEKIPGIKQIIAIRRGEDEILYAIKCMACMGESNWLQNKNFAPGDYAIGWPGLYVLFRSLDAVRPLNILELGMGETTKMISQYATAYGCNHIVVEHSKEWISFYTSNVDIGDCKILNLELEKTIYDKSETIRYGNFKERVIQNIGDNKIDYIVIDGPFGGEKYSRVDVLDLIGDELADSFVIIVDDTHRTGERNTVDLIQKKLSDCGREYCVGTYRGKKYTTIIASTEYGFLCSL